MASQEEIDRLKQVIGETTLTDDELSSIIDQEGNLDAAAQWVWRTKAANYVGMVNVSESGSSRQLSDVFEHALKMAQLNADGDTGGSRGRSGTRKIVRE